VRIRSRKQNARAPARIGSAPNLDPRTIAIAGLEAAVRILRVNGWKKPRDDVDL
jgi:hypothetical protein